MGSSSDYMVWLSSWGLLLVCETDGPLVFILFSSAAPLVKRAGDFYFFCPIDGITKFNYEGTKKQQNAQSARRWLVLVDSGEPME